MSQVSCRMFEMYERGAAELGIPAQQLLEGTTLTLAVVRDKRNRAPWDEWVIVCQNFEDAVGGPEVMRRWGSRILEHDYTSVLRRVAGFFLTTEQLYRAVISWMAPVLYPHLEFDMKVEGGRLVLSARIPEPHRGAPAWFRLVEGTLVVLPRFLGNPDAEVRGQIADRRAVFTITTSARVGRLRRARVLAQSVARPRELLQTLEEVRKDVDQAYRDALAAEQELRALLQGLPDPVVVLSGTTIVETNRAWRDLFGQPKAAELLDLVAPDQHERARALIAGARLEEDGELVLERKDGRATICEVSGSSPLHYRGRPVKVVTLRDVTARREEEELIALAERVSSLGVVAAGVAHDINNPLAAVVGHLDVLSRRLRKGSHPDQTRTLLDEVEAAMDGALRVAEIARSLIDLPQGEGEQASSARVEETLEAMLKVARNEIRHRATLERDFEPVGPAAISPVRLGQVLLNLIVNAAQAIPTGHVDDNRIVLRTRENGEGGIVITVSDTGPGIEAEDVARVFEPFRTTKGASGGHGMGLAMCRRIVEQAGGGIEARSVQGEGATFEVVLPIASVEPAPERSESTEPTTARKLRITVVDDEELLRGVLARMLGDHEVQLAASGREGLALLLEGPLPDLVFCDVMMPDLTGLEVLTQARAERPELADRFVFITGGAFGQEVAAALEALPNRRLDKPFRYDELMGLVAEFAAASS